MTEDKALYWLSLGGINALRQNKLLEIFGSASDVYDAFPSEKLREFMGERAYAVLRRSRDEGMLDAGLSKLEKAGVRLIFRGSSDYPPLLDQPEVVPPPVLYVSGNAGLLKKRAVCMVGTRRCTDYGKRVASEWAAELSRRFVIVTGHATGIDTYAAKSCLASGGSAVMVLACGIDMFDKPDWLRKCDPASYALVTEYPTGTRTAKFSYHERNRLLSGLTEATVVVEAGERSGALITADRAAAQNRTVFAVPGSVYSDRSRGTLSLLRNGAAVARSAADIFEDLDPGFSSALALPDESEPPHAEMTEEERRVCEFLSDGKRHFDDIAAMLALPSFEASSLLSMMELEGLIEKKMQNYYALLK